MWVTRKGGHIKIYPPAPIKHKFSTKTNIRTTQMEPISSSPLDLYKQFDTPTNARIQGAIEFARHKGFLRSKREVFEFYGMGHIRGYEILKSSTTCRRHNTGRPDP